MDLEEELNAVELLESYILEHSLDNSVKSLRNGYSVLLKTLVFFDNNLSIIKINKQKESLYNIIHKCHNEIFQYYTDSIIKAPQNFVFPLSKFEILLKSMNNFQKVK